MSKIVNVEFTDEQFQFLERKAKQQRVSLTLYLAQVALEGLSRGKQKAPDDESFKLWAVADELKEGREFYNRLYSTDLYRFYVRWCHREAIEPCTHALFARHMTMTGIPKQRNNQGVYFYVSTLSIENEYLTSRLGKQEPQKAIIR